MLKKTITYKDFNDVERTEDFYFNFSESELVEMELGTEGGLSEMLKKIVSAQDQPTLIKFFKNIILRAYGEKSPDGRRFIKNDEVREGFSQTNAFNVLFMELASNSDKAAEFITGLIPSSTATGQQSSLPTN